MERSVLSSLEIVREHWDGKTNNSPKAKKLKAELESRGHTDVHVWWEHIGPAMEMCGNSGGYMCVTDPLDEIEPLGHSFDEAIEHIKTATWLQRA